MLESVRDGEYERVRDAFYPPELLAERMPEGSEEALAEYRRYLDTVPGMARRLAAHLREQGILSQDWSVVEKGVTSERGRDGDQYEACTGVIVQWGDARLEIVDQGVGLGGRCYALRFLPEAVEEHLMSGGD